MRRIALQLSVLMVLTAAPARADPTLVLRGRFGWEPGVGQRSMGIIAITLPLDRLVAPQLAQGPAAPPPPGPSLILPALARDTVRVALRVAGFGDCTRRLDSLAGRSRSSAMLPELRLRGGRSTDEVLRLTPTADDPYRYTQAGGAELFLEAQLTWRLQRLLFAAEEIRVEQLRHVRASARARLVDRVLRLLFAWQRSRLRLATATLTPEQQAEAVLVEVEAESTLDVLTEGWFSDRIRP